MFSWGLFWEASHFLGSLSHPLSRPVSLPLTLVWYRLGLGLTSVDFPLVDWALLWQTASGVLIYSVWAAQVWDPLYQLYSVGLSVAPRLYKSHDGS